MDLSSALSRVIVQDPRDPRPYLFSNGQNMYNRVVLVCTVKVYIPNSEVPGNTGNLGDVWPLRLVWQLTKYVKIAP